MATWAAADVGLKRALRDFRHSEVNVGQCEGLFTLRLEAKGWLGELGWHQQDWLRSAPPEPTASGKQHNPSPVDLVNIVGCPACDKSHFTITAQYTFSRKSFYVMAAQQHLNRLSQRLHST